MPTTKKRTRLPRLLTRSMAYYDNPTAATELWDAGFRPMEAQDLEERMVVAFKPTDVFRLGPDSGAEPEYGVIYEVDKTTEMYGGERVVVEVRVTHGYRGGDAITEADPEDEVWARPASDR